MFSDSSENDNIEFLKYESNLKNVSLYFPCIFGGVYLRSALHTYKDIETVRKLILSTLSFSSAWYIALTEIV